MADQVEISIPLEIHIEPSSQSSLETQPQIDEKLKSKKSKKHKSSKNKREKSATRQLSVKSPIRGIFKYFYELFIRGICINCSDKR